jgi:hypothetical protein
MFTPAARSALHAALTVVNTAVREDWSRDAQRLVHLGSVVLGAAWPLARGISVG